MLCNVYFICHLLLAFNAVISIHVIYVYTKDTIHHHISHKIFLNKSNGWTLVSHGHVESPLLNFNSLALMYSNTNLEKETRSSSLYRITEILETCLFYSSGEIFLGVLLPREIGSLFEHSFTCTAMVIGIIFRWFNKRFLTRNIHPVYPPQGMVISIYIMICLLAWTTIWIWIVYIRQ